MVKEQPPDLSGYLWMDFYFVYINYCTYKTMKGLNY